MGKAIKIDAFAAHRDYKLLKQFSELISDFDRLRNAILFSEVLDEMDYDVSNDIRKFWKKKDEECVKHHDKKESNEDTEEKEVEIREVNDFESFRKMLKDLLI